MTFLIWLVVILIAAIGLGLTLKSAMKKSTTDTVSNAEWYQRLLEHMEDYDRELGRTGAFAEDREPFVAPEPVKKTKTTKKTPVKKIKKTTTKKRVTKKAKKGRK